MSDAVGDFVSWALLDAPVGGSDDAPHVGLADTMLHTLRTAYPGMTEVDVLDMDLRKVWGAFRCIRRERDPKAILFNPLSDPVKSRFLASIQPRPAPQKSVRKSRKK